MAIYTTFFLCKPEELPGGFPGWRLPLAKPVRREFRNPFTGELSVVEPTTTLARNAPSTRRNIRPSRSRRLRGLSGRPVAPFVRALPHWRRKG